MNYRHIYHAGNFADVFKHLLMVLCLDRLREKEAPFFALDAHGGCGLYNLHSEEAQKTKEFEDGIGRLMAAAIKNADVNLYLSKVREDWKKGKYPGSPLIIARMLRAQDRLTANELHPDDVKILRQTLGPRKNAEVTEKDAYVVLRAKLPPPEKRGMAVIDPPFEKTDEFETLAKQMREWQKRWATGTYLIWYPVKDHLSMDTLYKTATALGLNRTWVCEYRSNAPAEGNKLRATGLMLLNAPYQVPERMDAAMAEAAPVLGGVYTSQWLVPDGEKPASKA
jgi:23S rRNA (adenine2030-N6)-methyltransferase